MLHFVYRISVIDSHTGGEPTRVVLDGFPDLGPGSIVAKAQRLACEFDHFRQAVILEPRGSDVWVGAMLVPPTSPSASAGVIFFNNAGLLGMCGHGMIGAIETLSHLGRLTDGDVLIETPAGDVTCHRHPDRRISVQNVPSFRYRADVCLRLEGQEAGSVCGDIAYGGNWFFITDNHGHDLDGSSVRELGAYATAVKNYLAEHGITGEGGEEIDHIELVGPSKIASAKNFVLCPGGAYDRSPCGTGTSAKIACLAATGKLQPGEIWRQESITGSIFEASYQVVGEKILPTITGTAWITAETTFLLHPSDPLRWGLV